MESFKEINIAFKHIYRTTRGRCIFFKVEILFIEFDFIHFENK